MACHLATAEPLFEPMLDPWKQISVNLDKNLYVFIKENIFENVIWKLAAILSQTQYVES